MKEATKYCVCGHSLFYHTQFGGPCTYMLINKYCECEAYFDKTVACSEGNRINNIEYCPYCKSREFLKILGAYGWCRVCIYENLKIATCLPPDRLELAIKALNDFPELPQFFKSKNIGENKIDLEIDFGVLRGKIRNMATIKDIL